MIKTFKDICLLIYEPKILQYILAEYYQIRIKI